MRQLLVHYLTSEYITCSSGRRFFRGIGDVPRNSEKNDCGKAVFRAKCTAIASVICLYLTLPMYCGVNQGVLISSCFTSKCDSLVRHDAPYLPTADSTNLPQKHLFLVL